MPSRHLRHNDSPPTALLASPRAASPTRGVELRYTPVASMRSTTGREGWFRFGGAAAELRGLSDRIAGAAAGMSRLVRLPLLQPQHVGAERDLGVTHHLQAQLVGHVLQAAGNLIGMGRQAGWLLPS